MRNRIKLFFQNTKNDGTWENIGTFIFMIVFFIPIIIFFLVVGICLVAVRLYETTGISKKKRQIDYRQRLIMYFKLPPDATEEKIKELKKEYSHIHEWDYLDSDSFKFEDLPRKAWLDYCKNS